jgi:mRNA interferase RelE/StbE
MTYKIYLSSPARKFYQKADDMIKKKLFNCFKILQETPKTYPMIKSLKGKMSGKYRYRIGDYRVIYLVKEETQQVIIETIAHRRDVYE